MSVNFVTNISWSANPQLLSAKNFGINVPAGLAATNVRQPVFVDVAGMERVTRQGASKGNSGEHSSRVSGLVTKDVKVRFENINSQWRCTPLGGTGAKNGPAKFQFQGGTVYLDLLLGIYILNPYQPNEQDKISTQLFATIFDHELLHVWDEIDILNNLLVPKLPDEPNVKRYLVQAEPYIFGNKTHLIAQLGREFRPFIQERIETEAFNLKSEESDKRQQRRDSPAEYKIVDERVRELQRKQVNSK